MFINIIYTLKSDLNVDISFLKDKYDLKLESLDCEFSSIIKNISVDKLKSEFLDILNCIIKDLANNKRFEI